MNQFKKRVLYAGTDQQSDSSDEMKGTNSMELLRSSKGFKDGLKYLVSENFKDFDAKTRPEFGIPTVQYEPHGEDYEGNA